MQSPSNKNLRIFAQFATFLRIFVQFFLSNSTLDKAENKYSARAMGYYGYYVMNDGSATEKGSQIPTLVEDCQLTLPFELRVGGV